MMISLGALYTIFCFVYIGAFGFCGVVAGNSFYLIGELDTEEYKTRRRYLSTIFIYALTKCISFTLVSCRYMQNGIFLGLLSSLIWTIVISMPIRLLIDLTASQDKPSYAKSGIVLLIAPSWLLFTFMSVFVLTKQEITVWEFQHIDFAISLSLAALAICYSYFANRVLEKVMH